MRVRTVLTVALVGLALLLAAGAAQAGRGPRASIASWTACALDLGENGGGAKLVVTTTLTNKSSGNRIAEVRGGTIVGTYKPVGVPGGHKVNVEFDSHDIGDLGDVDPDLTIMTEFDICDVFELARDLNGKATVDYGLKDGTEEDERTVMNRCSDDPETDAADCTAEGVPYDCCTGAGAGACDEGAIKVADYFDLIFDACQ